LARATHAESRHFCLFFHADPKRALFKGMILQYIEQNMAHW
jgi:hypothetical protein